MCWLLSFEITYSNLFVSIENKKMSSTKVTTITNITVDDIRFPTSEQLDGSDAMNPDP